MWPILGPILGGLITIAIAILLALRPRDGWPAFAPDPRSLQLAIALALIAGLLYSVSLHISVLFGYFTFGAVIAAFLLGGAGLRPRGSRGRGILLGAAVYLIAGVVWVLVLNRGFVGDLDLVAWLLQVLAWPGLLYLFLGNLLG